MSEVSRLAQVNYARLRHPVDSPLVREFLAAVDDVERLAERSPGFVWRYRSPGGHVNGAAVLGDPRAVVAVSVWADYASLHALVYRSRHGHFVRRRDEWFERVATPATALWWVPDGQWPTPEQAMARLAHLRRVGPTPRAFTVRTRFTPDGGPEVKGEFSPGVRTGRRSSANP